MRARLTKDRTAAMLFDMASGCWLIAAVILSGYLVFFGVGP